MGHFISYCVLVSGILISGTCIAITFDHWWIWLISVFIALLPRRNFPDKNTQNNTTYIIGNTDDYKPID